MKSSKFGRGLVYNLGMFLAHAERYTSQGSLFAPETWFNGASDHLYEIEWESIKNKRLQNRLVSFIDKCLGWGHGFPSKKSTPNDREWAIAEAKTILRLIDRSNNIKSTVAEWS